MTRQRAHGEFRTIQRCLNLWERHPGRMRWPSTRRPIRRREGVAMGSFTMKSFKMESFKIAAGAVLVLASIPSGAAQPVNYHSSSSKAGYTRPDKALNTRGLPRSTVAAGSAGKLTSGHSELDRLEHQASNQLQAESRHQARPASAPVHLVHAQSSSHESEIHFSYHSPSSQMSRASASASSGRRR